MQAVRGGCGGTQGAGGTAPPHNPQAGKTWRRPGSRSQQSQERRCPPALLIHQVLTPSQRLLGPALCQALGG